MYMQPQVAPPPVEFSAEGRGVLPLGLEKDLDDAEAEPRDGRQRILRQMSGIESGGGKADFW